MIRIDNVREIHINVPSNLYARPGFFGECYPVTLPGGQYILIHRWWGDQKTTAKRTRKPWGWFTGKPTPRARQDWFR